MSGRIWDHYKVLVSYLPKSHGVKTQTVESEWHINDINIGLQFGLSGCPEVVLNVTPEPMHMTNAGIALKLSSLGNQNAEKLRKYKPRNCWL